MRNYLIHYFIATLSFALLPSVVLASTGESPALLKQLNTRIAAEEKPVKKAKLYVYRARYHVKNKQLDQAVDDYNLAIELDHKSWIHLERAKLHLALKNFDLAKEDASAAKEENPNLCMQADPLIEKASHYLQITNKLENPPTIELDREVNPYKKSRFDVARELGVDGSTGSFLVTRTGKSSSAGKTASSSSSSSKPRKS